MSSATAARQAALETLTRCRRDGAWSGSAMETAVRKYALDRRDAAFASRLCLSVLENSALCDFYIDAFCSAKLEPAVRDILRMGICQLLFFDRVPARAAVWGVCRPVQKRWSVQGFGPCQRRAAALCRGA